MMHHVTLNTGVMMLKNSALNTGINYSNNIFLNITGFFFSLFMIKWW